jgi:hypothetical protein
MLTRGEDVEVHVLKERGWSISAIARHLGRDRKKVRSYLNGDREPGVRVTSVGDPLAEFEVYVRARFVDDPHLWATSLFDEVVALGYARSYPTFVRQVRVRGLRPRCEACFGVKGRDTIEIEHPPGAEIQWDWFERRRAPWGATAYVLLGTLPYSSRTRGVLAESLDQAHLIEAMDAVSAVAETLRRPSPSLRGGRSVEWATVRGTEIGGDGGIIRGALRGAASAAAGGRLGAPGVPPRARDRHCGRHCLRSCRAQQLQRR